MNHNIVKDSWESSNKQQQTGILDRLAYLKSVLSYMLILFHLLKNSTNVKKFPSGLLLPFLTEHLVRTKYWSPQEGRLMH